ncbi:MAG: metal-dependent hydrolase [Candidatus Bathyarchaeia archaeon]
MGIKSYAIGHFALGYLTAKLAGNLTKTKINVPLVLTLSVAPDIDLLIPFVEHRGPFHSILTTIVIFIPAIVLFGKGAFPYLAALLQHSLLGDFITGNVQLFWPLTTQLYGTGMDIESLANIIAEWTMLMAMLIGMLKARDLQLLLKPNNSNIILVIPTLTVLLPSFLAFPLRVPAALIIPHLLMLAIFLASIFTDVRKAIQKT